ncbi:MAG TPA: PilZ domain-containing protein [Candidatus Binatia bacterium]|nr:PilZ domain-containing protein [Candidatus Binatia bacterium]
MSSQETTLPPIEQAYGAVSVDKLIHLALPVRLTRQSGAGQEFACTYDIHPQGARLLGSSDVKPGDLVTVERGRLKSLCQVIWAGDPNSALRGQFTVKCIAGGKIPWEEELRQMEEQYLPLVPGGVRRREAQGAPNRRRRPRYEVTGDADVVEIGGKARGEGRLEQISEFGCLIAADETAAPGSALRLVLRLCDVSVALHGNVRYTTDANRAMGIEFQEIRQGDRPLFDYVLERLRRPRKEDFADLEVITQMAGTK